MTRKENDIGQLLPSKKLKTGSQYRVTGFAHTIDAAYRRRLLCMGFVPGSSFTVKRQAPLGDPIEIALGHSRLSLRRKELAFLQLEEQV